MVLLVAIYGAIILGSFYVARPKELLDFDLLGLGRLLVLSSCIYACYLMVSALWAQRGRSSKATSRDGRRSRDSRDVSTRAPASHPFITAFRRHPVLTAVIFVFWLSFPPALVLIAGLPHALKTPMWEEMLIAEIFALIALVIAWVHRRKRDASS
jgi:hypothetical protein